MWVAGTLKTGANTTASQGTHWQEAGKGREPGLKLRHSPPGCRHPE